MKPILTYVAFWILASLPTILMSVQFVLGVQRILDRRPNMGEHSSMPVWLSIFVMPFLSAVLLVPGMAKGVVSSLVDDILREPSNKITEEEEAALHNLADNW